MIILNEHDGRRALYFLSRGFSELLVHRDVLLPVGRWDSGRTYAKWHSGQSPSFEKP